MLFWLSVLQIILLIVRGGMLFLLAGTLPLAAAATNTTGTAEEPAGSPA
ncbi:hypothetical protein [Kribbella sp. NBC_00359]